MVGERGRKGGIRSRNVSTRSWPYLSKTSQYFFVLKRAFGNVSLLIPVWRTKLFSVSFFIIVLSLVVRPYFALRDVTLLEAKTRVCWISDSRLVCELTVDRLIKFVVGICLLQITVVKNVELKTVDTTINNRPKIERRWFSSFQKPENIRCKMVPWSNLFALFQVSIRSQRIALCRRFHRR